MERRHSRRAVLAGAVGATAAAATAAAGGASGTGRGSADGGAGGAAETGTPPACAATVDTNATTADGEPKLEVPRGEATVTGTSTCDPGTELTVRARSSDDDSPFLKQVETTLREDGTWAVTLDFEDVEVGSRFRLQVLGLEESLATVRDCEVVADVGTDASTASATDSGSPTLTATPTDTEVSTPGDEWCSDYDDAVGECTASPTQEAGPSTPGPDAWLRLLRPLAVSTGVATVGLLAVGVVLLRWRLAPGEEP
jgi:hypothetical protein